MGTPAASNFSIFEWFDFRYLRFPIFDKLRSDLGQVNLETPGGAQHTRTFTGTAVSDDGDQDDRPRDDRQKGSAADHVVAEEFGRHHPTPPERPLKWPSLIGKLGR